MKKILLFTTLMIASILIQAQEVISDGNMESEDSWTSYWRTDASDEGNYTFGYTADTPSDGEGGCLEVYGYGQSGIFVFQEVTLDPGAAYTFNGVIKNISTEPLASTWVELILSSNRPDDTNLADWGASAGDFIYAQNSWMAEPYNTMDTDGTFEETYQFTWKAGDDGDDMDLTGSAYIIIPDTAITTWYVCFKAGCWNTAGVESPAYHFLIDNLSLLGEGGTGVNLIDQSTKLVDVYPNPSTGIVNVKTLSNSVSLYSILDLSGRTVLDGSISQTSTIDLSTMKKGLYVINVTSGSTTEHHKLILK